MSLVYFNTPFNLGDWNDSSWPFGAAVTAGGQPSQITRGKQRIYNSSVVEPKMDWIEQDNKCIALIELPGIKKKEVTLSLSGDTLTISGTFTPGHGISENVLHLITERRFGPFSRALRVPFGLKEDRIRATMECGLLRVEFPKRYEEDATKKIVIEGDE